MSYEQVPSTSACPHPEAVGRRWGDPISEERQAELQGYLDRWEAETDHGKRKGPFDQEMRVNPRLQLTGADVFWLAAESGRSPLVGAVQNLHLEGVHLANSHLEQANLRGAHLERAFLIGAYLEQAVLIEVHLEEADLRAADLEQANLRGAHLEGADLSEASLDSKTALINVKLDGETRLGDVQWGGVGAVNLTRLPWDQVATLGDEHNRARDQAYSLEVIGNEQEVGERARNQAYAVRAYRQVATQLRVQGMNEVADRFLYRAQVLQRRVFLRRFRIPQYLGSLFLDLISGYGYRPVRSLIAYIVVILGFAAAYFALGGANGSPLQWNEAIVISMTAFHGRGFFSSVFQPGDIQAAVAAGEAFIGLLIEIVLIATFTQRFFAR
jgi:hypothetical protein